MRVLVTGHHGYIGSIMTRVLKDSGHEVTGVDTFYYEGCDAPVPGTSISSIRADIRDLDVDHLREFEAVAHLAALSNDPLGEFNPDITREINFAATLRLARSAKAAGVRRFVFASSCSMYGAAADGAPVDEDAPLRPLTAYAESKVRSEEALLGLVDSNFAPVFMRNATAYGASPRLRVDLVLNNLVGWAVTTGRVRILSDGTPWRPLVHVEDIARATAAALEAPESIVRGQAFNVGQATENYQVRDLAEIVQEVVGDCEIEFAGSGDPDPRSYRVSFAKLERTFPKLRLSWSARDGARELLEVYHSLGMNLTQFESDRFVRLKRLRRLIEEERVDASLRWRTLAPA